MANKMQSTGVWDLPVRICHWLMVFLFVAQWATAQWLNDKIELHAKIGYVFIAVVVFRIVWGFCGTYYARFTTFLYHPYRIIDYTKNMLKPHSPVHLSHNPLGGIMVLILLSLLLLQGISGLFMTDDIFFNAPYYYSVSASMQTLMSNIHHYAFCALKISIAVHIVAVFMYTFMKKQALISAMFTGNKPSQSNVKPHSTHIKTYWLRWLIAASLVALLMYLIVAVWAPEPEALWY